MNHDVRIRLLSILRPIATRAFVLLALVAMAIMAYGAWIVALQGYVWLQTDKWHEVPLLILFGAYGAEYPKPLGNWLPSSSGTWLFASWLNEPSTWLGIHHVVRAVLSYLGLGFTLLVGTFFSFMGLVIATPEAERR